MTVHLCLETYRTEAADVILRLPAGTPFTVCGRTWPPNDWPEDDGWSRAPDLVDGCPACSPPAAGASPSPPSLVVVQWCPQCGELCCAGRVDEEAFLRGDCVCCGAPVWLLLARIGDGPGAIATTMPVLYGDGDGKVLAAALPDGARALPRDLLVQWCPACGELGIAGATPEELPACGCAMCFSPVTVLQARMAGLGGQR